MFVSLIFIFFATGYTSYLHKTKRNCLIENDFSEHLNRALNRVCNFFFCLTKFCSGNYAIFQFPFSRCGLFVTMSFTCGAKRQNYRYLRSRFHTRWSCTCSACGTWLGSWRSFYAENLVRVSLFSMRYLRFVGSWCFVLFLIFWFALQFSTSGQI